MNLRFLILIIFFLGGCSDLIKSRWLECVATVTATEKLEDFDYYYYTLEYDVQKLKFETLEHIKVDIFNQRHTRKPLINQKVRIKYLPGDPAWPLIVGDIQYE